MNRRIASLLAVIAAACTASFLLSNEPESFLTLDRSKRADKPLSATREVMKHARNTRSIPINAELVLRRVAPGSPDGPVDLHHQPWDWVEVYNRSDRAVPMKGYSLSDNPDRVRKYRFPAIVIPPKSSCRVWLSGFVSMNSIWSLTPTDAVDARGWKAQRNDDLADRFTYMWKGFEPPKGPPFQLEWPVHVTESGRYAVWLHAGPCGDEDTSRLHVNFRDEKFDVALERADSLADVLLKCPSSKDGYWELPAGTHTIGCRVVEGESLINQVAVLRYDIPFGLGRQDLHAGFKLDQGGEFIGLFDPNGVVVDHVTTPAMKTGTMATRDPNKGGAVHLEPVGEMAGTDPLPIQPTFNVPSGPVEERTAVSIASDDPTVTIRYTLNGELPSVASAQVDGSISVASNTFLRARAFDADGRYGPVAEATYWVGQPTDLPILSVIAEPDQLYDYSHGIMYNTSIRGMRSERRCHITLIETNGQAIATVGGMRIQGRSSRQTSTKRNFRFVFRERYGQAHWPGTMFAGKGPERCRSVVATGRNIVRNQLAHGMMDLASVRSPRRKAVRLFVNGENYGLYLLVEDVQDPNYLESVFGHLDLDVIKEKTFEPVKWGSSTRFDQEILPYTATGDRQMTYELLSELMDVATLSRWFAVVQVAGIDDNGQGYYVRNNRAERQPWSIINWDFDHAFTVSADKGWVMPQGYRSRLVLNVKNTSETFQKKHYFPSLQHMVNHVMPLSQLSKRVRKLQALYAPYLEAEFEAHLNQRSFDDGPPDREAFMALHYYRRAEQLLQFVDTRFAAVPADIGVPVFGGLPHRVQIHSGNLTPDLTIDTWPARDGYLGHYYPGTEITVSWKDESMARPLAFEINGTTQRLTELRTNITENLVIRIRDT